MNTATTTTTTTTETLTPTQQEAFDDILGLMDLAKATNYQTFKTQRKLFDALTPHDAAVVGRALVKRKRPIYTKSIK
jgi:hypothetical protein